MFLLLGGDGDVDVHDDGQVIRDVEIEAGQMMDGETSGADQVQDVTTAVCWEVDVLREVAAVKGFLKFRGIFAGRVVNMNVKIT